MKFEEVFNDSYERVLRGRTGNANFFFDSFYACFIGTSPTAAEKLQGVDMKRQKSMLKQSLYYMLNLFALKQIPDQLVKIAHRHDRAHADIPPELYALWMDCLIVTVREEDPYFSADVELAWRMILAPGIAFMIHMYDR